MASPDEGSRTAVVGRKRRRNDDAIDLAHESEKRRKVEKDLDYVPLEDSDDGATGNEGDDDGDSVDDTDMAVAAVQPDDLVNTVTHQRSECVTSGALTTKTQEQREIQLTDIPMKSFRDRVQFLMAEEPNRSVRDTLESIASRDQLFHRKAMNFLQAWQDTQQERRMELTDLKSDRVRERVREVTNDHPTWSVEAAVAFTSKDTGNTMKKIRNRARRYLTEWQQARDRASTSKTEPEAEPEAQVGSHVAPQEKNDPVPLVGKEHARIQTGLSSSSSSIDHVTHSSMFRPVSFELKDVAESSRRSQLWKRVTELMRPNESGVALTADAALWQLRQAADQLFRKPIAKFVTDQHVDCERSLNVQYSIDLATVVQQNRCFRQPLDVDALFAITSVSANRDYRDFGDFFHGRCERKMGKPAVGHLFRAMNNIKFHVAACEAMRQYLKDHLILPPSASPVSIRLAETSAGDDNGKRPPTTLLDDLGEDTAARSAKRAINTLMHDSASSASETQSLDAMSASRGQVNNTGSLGSSDAESGEILKSGTSTESWDGVLRLRDLSPQAQRKQALYWRIINPEEEPKCNCCEVRGHIEEVCPEKTCKHCGRQHFTHRCPMHKKCKRCRERGHRAKTCQNRSVIAGAPGDECDVCGKLGHAEEECAGLWINSKPAENWKPIPRGQLVVSCYNCGRENHFGDDCPELPDYVSKNFTYRAWSMEVAEKGLSGHGVKPVEEKVNINVGRGNDATGRDVGIQAYQLAQLGDWA